jgi:replication fork protection complex subunit Csm3/Swi3
MSSIDNIWDDPVESEPRPAQQPLFLDGSDDETPVAKQKTPAPNNDDVDIDAMFADIEDDDEFSLKPLGPSVDTEALRKEAEARHGRNLPPLTPHAIMSSSPPRPTADDGRGASGTGEKGKGKDDAKPRRKAAVLDEGRLLGPDGFPKLIKDIKNFRTKGKGHEVRSLGLIVNQFLNILQAADLDRLLRVYGYWTHALYPKTVFKDTVDRIEKLCHSKRMNVWYPSFTFTLNAQARYRLR